MDSPLISFVILTCNRREQLVDAVMSVRKQRYPNREIVVVDNASTDGTVEFVREAFPDVKVVVNETNVGTAAGRNRGIEASSGEYVVLLDDDCVLDDDGVAWSVARTFRADTQCGAIAFRIIDPSTGRMWPYNRRVRTTQPVVYERAVFCTGGVALRRRTLEEAGHFWEPLFIGDVDTELSLRIVGSGWRIMQRNDIVVWHPAPPSGMPLDPQREVYFRVRNTLWLALRVMPFSLMPALVIPRCLRTGILAVRTGRIDLFVRAIVDALRGVPICLKDRRPLPRAWVHRARRLRLKLWF